MKRIGLVVALAAAACSAPANLPELAQAESHERAGEDDQALASYRAAQRSCVHLEPARRRREICAMALVGEAELLERQGKTAEALHAYATIPERSGNYPPPSAQGLYRAGLLALDGGDQDRARTYFWKVVRNYPDEPFAGDAIGALVRDGRQRDPRALWDQLSRLVKPLGATQVGDNLLWALADLAEHELSDRAAARSLYDRIPVDHPGSGLRDDARWHGARLSLELDDPKGAVQRLRALLATREVAFGAGSYFSVWLDDAQLLLGQVLRDRLSDLPGAAAAFRRLPEDYPASVLRDDAVMELAETLAKSGDTAGACGQLDVLARDWPDSKHRARRAPELAQRLGCAPPKKEAR